MRFLPRFCAGIFVLAASLQAAPIDTGNFTEAAFVQDPTGISKPVRIEWAPDGSNRLFLVQQNGLVRVIHASTSGTGANATTTGTLSGNFASLGSYCLTGGDEDSGAESFCFDPDYLNNHYVYFMTSVPPTGTNAASAVFKQQIIRYTDSSSVGTNKTILMGDGTTSPILPMANTSNMSGVAKASQHDGGALGIGFDGRLYWSIGDTGTAGAYSPDLTLFRGKMCRINRATAAPCNDNPYFGGTGTAANYIWASGLRNSYQIIIQPVTGDIWLSGCGSTYAGDNTTNWGYEMIYKMTRGANEGWVAYEANGPPGYIQPILNYSNNGGGGGGENNGQHPFTIATAASSGATRINGISTITTITIPGSHPPTGARVWNPFRPGQKVTIAGVTPTSFNGTYYVLQRLSDSQFTIAQPSLALVNVLAGAGGGGTASEPIPGMGGCITAGTFYNSTAFPAAYQGNYFFADYQGTGGDNPTGYSTANGTLYRATINASNTITNIDTFGMEAPSFPLIHTITGPDGALYFTAHDTTNARVKRLAYTGSTAQNLIIYPTDVRVVEGSSAGSLFTIRLAQQPASNVIVSVAKTGGAANINLSGSDPATLTFTPANWNQLQTVTISATPVTDFGNHFATFLVSSSGLPSYKVTGVSLDNKEPSLVISAANLPANFTTGTFTQGTTATFTVNLASAPASPVTVTVARVSGSSSITVSGGSSLTFNSSNYSTPQTVTIAAAQDAIATDTALISVSLPGEPVRTVRVKATTAVTHAPSFTSTPVTTAIVNTPYTYAVRAAGSPSPTYTLTSPPSGMTIASNVTLASDVAYWEFAPPSVGVISWTPTTTGNNTITIGASNSSGTATPQVFTLTVNADNPPTAAITSPTAGATLSGTTADFYGVGTDDVNCLKADFYVDSVFVANSSDIHTTNNGTYYCGGAPALFNTTQFSNGSHTLTMQVTDTAAHVTTSAGVQVNISNVAPVITSTPVTTVTVNSPYSTTVVATGPPTPTYSLATAPAGMSIHPVTGVISWTPSTTGSNSVTVSASNGVTPAATQSFTVNVLVATGNIAGTVTDTSSVAISGATVSVVVSGTTYSATSGSDGTYTINSVPVGTGYTVTASATGYVNGTATNVTVTGSATTPGVNFALTATPGTITGTVTDNTSAAISGASVSVVVGGTTYSTTSGSDGTYSIGSVPAGTGYTVTASATGYLNGTATNIAVAPGGTTSGINFALSPVITTGTITGTVTNSASAAIAGASVSVVVGGTTYSTTSGSDGTYAIGSVPAGTGYTVTAGKSGYASNTATGVAVTSGGTTANVNITLTTTFASWAATYPGIGGPTANPVGDGISNELKYAFNLNPTVADRSGLPVLGTTTVSGSQYLTLTYTQLTVAGDLTYTIESSSDMATWSTITPVVVNTVNNGVTQTVTVRDPVALNASTRRFLRVVVTATN